MKKLILFASVALLALLSGCTTYYRDSVADHLTYSSGVANARYVTEFEIDKIRVKAEGTAAVLFGIFHIAEDKRCLSMQDPNFSVFEFLGKILSPIYHYSKCQKCRPFQCLRNLRCRSINGYNL